MGSMTEPSETTNATRSGSTLQGRLLCIGAALLWSTSGLFIKTLTAPAPDGPGWSGWQVAGLRSLVAGFTLCLLSLVPWGPTTTLAPDTKAGRRAPGAHEWFIALMMALTMLAYVLAQTYTSTANAILLQYAAPIYVLLLSPWLLDERLKPRDLLAVGAIAAGILLIVPSSTTPGERFGNLMGLLSGVGFAAVILTLRKWRDGNGVRAMAIGNFITAAAALPVAAAAKQGLVPLGPVTAAQIMFLGVFQIGVAYFLFQRSVQILRATEASLLTLLEPVACPLWAYLIIGDTPTGTTIAGGTLIVLTLALHSIAAFGISPRCLAPFSPSDTDARS